MGNGARQEPDRTPILTQVQPDYVARGNWVGRGSGKLVPRPSNAQSNAGFEDVDEHRVAGGRKADPSNFSTVGDVPREVEHLTAT